MEVEVAGELGGLSPWGLQAHLSRLMTMDGALWVDGSWLQA